MKACNACGKCCVKYSNGQLSASEQDIQLWDSFRPDITEFVSDDGLIWFDPSSKELIELCPWLKKDPDSARYLCGIYLDRPEDCRAYPATISDMIKDDCEMLEAKDLRDLKQAQQTLNDIMANDR
ncbi:MAG: YkgJ family cysteine cluster protein [Arenicella sp.]|nr:YkgJ family cysteine cluster protein [Arenicella sp.]